MTGVTLRARRATESDAALLLGWRNDEATRRASRSTEVVTEREHAAWLRATLARNDRILLVVEAERPVGTVRWDRLDGDSWELSITMAPGARGRGLAAEVLAAGEEALAGESPRRLVAVVRQENAAARHLFSSAGYEPTGDRQDGLTVLVKQVGRA